MYYGQAALVEKDERRYVTIVEEAAKAVCEVIDVSPVTTFFGDDAENSPISDILLGQYNHAEYHTPV
jgi:hypothetical protein